MGIPKAGSGQTHIVSKNLKHLQYNNQDRSTNRRPYNILQQEINSRQFNSRNVGTRSDTNVRPLGMPPRPITRRNPYKTPDPFQKTRSQSAGPTIRSNFLQNKTVKRRRKLKNTTKNKAQVENIPQETPNNSRQTSNHSSKQTSPRTVAQPKLTRLKAKEHEYLQFALSVTEEIIRNNLVENGDILNLFEKHFAANKGRLDEEKMDHHLKLLARELCVPYKDSLNLQLRQKIVSSIPVQVIGDCECVTRRNIALSNVERCLTGNEELKDIVVIKHSLSRVTECTEPSNSVDTIFNASTKFPSGTTVSSFGNVDILPCFENVDMDKRYSELDIHKLKEVNLRTLATLNSDNENNSVLEQKIRDHENYSKTGDSESIVQRSGILSSTPNSELSLTTANENDAFNRTDNSRKTVIRNDSIQFIDSLEQDKSLKSKTDSENSVLSNSLCDLLLKISSNDFEKPTENKTAENKSTQISKDLVDKECNTSNLFKLCKDNPDEDYVLINKPIYILKSILQSDERYILLKDSLNRMKAEESKAQNREAENNSDKEDIIFPKEKVHEYIEKVQSDESVAPSNKSAILEHSSKNIKYDNSSVQAEDSNFCLKENVASDDTLNISDYSIKSLSERDMYYMTKMNYSKLLTSDYDLTPQRDHPSTDKYHHLLVDAMTSISNINLGDSNLLLSEDYALPNTETLPPLCEQLEPNTIDISKHTICEDEGNTVPEIPTSTTHDIDNYILTSNNTGDSSESNPGAKNVSQKTANKTNTAYKSLPLISRSATFFVENKNDWRQCKNVCFNVDIPSSEEFSLVGKDDSINEQCQTDQTQIDVSTSISGIS